MIFGSEFLFPMYMMNLKPLTMKLTMRSKAFILKEVNVYGWRRNFSN